MASPSDPNLPDGDVHRDFMWGFMEQVLAEIGPRPSCREGERKLAFDVLRDHYRQLGPSGGRDPVS